MDSKSLDELVKAAKSNKPIHVMLLLNGDAPYKGHACGVKDGMIIFSPVAEPKESTVLRKLDIAKGRLDGYAFMGYFDLNEDRKWKASGASKSDFKRREAHCYRSRSTGEE